jgi:hypothetical protein
VEAAPAVDDEALAGDEPARLGAEEADGVGDVFAGSHAPGGYGREVGVAGRVGDVCVALDGDEARCDRVDGDAEGGEFARPAAGQSNLRVLGGGVGGPPRRGRSATSESIWTIRPWRRARIAGSTARPSSTGLLTKKSSWSRWSAYATGDRRFGLGAGGVEHQHVDRAEAVGHRDNELGDLALVGYVGGEGVGDPAAGADRAGDLASASAAAHVVDGDG